MSEPIPLKLVPPPPVEALARLRGGAKPLDIILMTAQAAWDRAQRPDGSIDLEAASFAASLAEKALPYLHPRFSPVTQDDAERREAKVVVVSGESLSADPAEATRQYQRIIKGMRP
jgi:hypothetical protein